MAAGANPKPASMRLVGGRGPGRDSGGRVVEPTPSFTRKAPEPPDWLPDEALAEWNRVVPGLMRLGLLKPEDRAALTAYCLVWHRMVEAHETLEAHGDHFETSTGQIRAHPSVRVFTESQQQLRQWASELGLTPASEGKVHSPGDDGADDPFSGA